MILLSVEAIEIYGRNSKHSEKNTLIRESYNPSLIMKTILIVTISAKALPVSPAVSLWTAHIEYLLTEGEPQKLLTLVQLNQLYFYHQRAQEKELGFAAVYGKECRNRKIGLLFNTTNLAISSHTKSWAKQKNDSLINEFLGKIQL